MPRYSLVPPRPDYPAASVAHYSSAALRKPVARRSSHTTARSSSLAFQGSLWGWAERSRQSSGPRLRHLRTVSVLTP
jgi:hypothetical protein